MKGSEVIRPNIYSVITSFSDDQKLDEVDLGALKIDTQLIIIRLPLIKTQLDVYSYGRQK